MCSIQYEPCFDQSFRIGPRRPRVPIRPPVQAIVRPIVRPITFGLQQLAQALNGNGPTAPAAGSTLGKYILCI